MAKNRYPDDKLQEFKELILRKLDKARKDYRVYHDSVTRADSNDTRDTSPTYKDIGDGATVLSHEESGKLAEHQLKFIRKLEEALIRIENKTYGVCRETGTLIDENRLRAVPHTTICIDAKKKQPESVSPGKKGIGVPCY